MRSRVAIVVALALVLVGCSANNGGSTSPSTPLGSASAVPTAATPEPSEAELSGTLTIWYVPTVETSVNTIKAQGESFTKANPGVNISYLYVPQAELSTKLIGAAGVSSGPDVILADGSNAKALSEAKALTDMTECVSTWPTAGDLVPAARRTVEERTYGVLPYGNLIALWYNKAILAKHALSPPTTVDELEKALATVTAGGDGGLTLNGTPDYAGSWTSQPFFSSFGVQFPEVDKPETTDVFSRMASWAEKGWVPRDVVGWSQADAMNQFLSGKYAFTVNGNWEVQHVKKDATFEYGVVPMPAGTSPAVVYIAGETVMMGGFAKDPDLACAYMRDTWFTEEGQLLSLQMKGSLPTLSTLLDDPSIKADPILSQYLTATTTAIPIEGGDTFAALNTVWGPSWSSVFAGGKDPATIAAETIDAVGKALPN